MALPSIPGKAGSRGGLVPGQPRSLNPANQVGQANSCDADRAVDAVGATPRGRATARRRQWVATAPGVSALAFLLLNAARRLIRLSALVGEKAGERE
jgi:hypothetical protein